MDGLVLKQQALHLLESMKRYDNQFSFALNSASAVEDEDMGKLDGSELRNTFSRVTFLMVLAHGRFRFRYRINKF